MLVRRWALLLIPALAGCAQPAGLEVKDAWSRETAGKTPNAAVFMTIRSEKADRLIGASAPVAEKTDLMTMRGGSGAMGMQYLAGIEIPAGTPVSLNPSGLHVWLANLDQPLRSGDTFPLTLRFEKAGERTVDVSVIAASAPPPTPGD